MIDDVELSPEIQSLYIDSHNKSLFQRTNYHAVWKLSLIHILFPFEETEDQVLAIEATKRDMESPKIMDRLICGDVGYGKTEIAIRAAFKAVQELSLIHI